MPADTSIPLPFHTNQELALSLDDDGARAALIECLLRDRLRHFCSAHQPEASAAPPFAEARPAGHSKACLVADPGLVAEVLRDKTGDYSNLPYAEIGGRGFMLAMDPITPDGTVDGTHGRQRAFAIDLLALPADAQLSQLALEAVSQALVAGLPRDTFDLAALAEQAALRFCGLAFGFAGRDHSLLQAAAAAGYRGLVHLIVGRHFSADPLVLPAARTALAQLTARCSALIEDYARLPYKPRTVHSRLPQAQRRAHWPEGVDPPDDWGLSAVGDPWLKRMAEAPGQLSVHELATVAVGLIVGTVGNVQASVCRALQYALADRDRLAAATEAAWRQRDALAQGPLADWLRDALGQRPPVAFLPRRVAADRKPTLGGQVLEPGADLILWLDAAAKGQGLPPPCAHALPFGLQSTDSPAPHGCIGERPARSLVTAIVGAVLRLPGLAEVCDPVTGRPEGLKQRWGFACESYPLTHQRARRKAQQPLNVVMRVKAPVEHHAQALRRVIAVGAPRIERALRESGHVHFAWFELLDQGRALALHTVYDGDFDAYVQHFALKVDELFDQLFAHIEGAPPLPVAENPGAFVDVIRAHNAAPLEGYFFSAHPELELPEILRQSRRRT